MTFKLELNKATVIDVREPYECALGMVENAINIPLNKIIHMVEEVNNMPKPVLLYCQTGNRSGQASMVLKARGVDHVFNAGGLNEMMELQRSS